MSALSDAAHKYAASAWPVLPLHNMRGVACSCGKTECSSPGKHPRLQHGLKDASTDAEQIDWWWQQWPNANIGLVTGIVFDVLDVDGADGIANLKAFLLGHDVAELPAGPRSHTGGDGWHVLFNPTGQGNRAGILPKVDWRGRNGYIVAPPSNHRSGNGYQWRHALDLPIPDAPDYIVDLLQKTSGDAPVGEHRTLPADAGDGTPYGRAALEGELRELSRAGQGQRNDTLNRSAYRLFRFCEGGELRDTVVEQQLRNAALNLGLSDHEATQTISSARAGAAGKALNAPRLLHGGHSNGTSALALNRAENAEEPLPEIGQALLDAVELEYGIVGPEAWRLAEQVTSRMTYERAVGLARKVIRDDRLVRESDLDTIVAISVDDLLAKPRVERTPLFGALLAEGHNATIVARWKVGKSTFVDNAAIAAGSGGAFLGSFRVPEPRRVLIFNYELDEDDMTDRLATYDIPGTARANIHIVNLRGRRLPITTSKGRDIVVRLLADLGTQLWIIDPFGAAYAAAGGQDENSNAEVRSFLIALDEIKRLAACPSLLMPVHTGRKVDQEGDEQGRGATVLEDWPDVRMLLTRGQKEQRDRRYLRTEGRAWELDESQLTFDPGTKGLGLPNSDIGISRKRAKTLEHAAAVKDAVAENPGANVNHIYELIADLGVTNTTDKSEALKEARRLHLVHYHPGKSNSQNHYIGAPHADDKPCPGDKNP